MAFTSFLVCWGTNEIHEGSGPVVPVKEFKDDTQIN